MDRGVAAHLRHPEYVPQHIGIDAPREALQIQDVVLHHLQSAEEIDEIIDLRDEIDLSVHAAAGRQKFEHLEKKETSWGSYSASNSAGSGSARSASSRWATN